MTIDVVIGYNLDRNTYELPITTSLRDAFERAGIDAFATSTFIDLNGAPIGPNDIEKTFEELCPNVVRPILMAVKKLDNA